MIEEIACFIFIPRLLPLPRKFGLYRVLRREKRVRRRQVRFVARILRTFRAENETERTEDENCKRTNCRGIG